MPFESQAQILGSVRILSISGDVDDRSTREFQTLLMKSSTDAEHSMLLDLGALGWMNSLCLRALVTLNRRLIAEGRRLAVCGLGDRMEKALEVAGLKHLLPIFATRSEAGEWLAARDRVDGVCRLAGEILDPEDEETSRQRAGRQRFDFGTQRVAAVAAELLQEAQSAPRGTAPSADEAGSGGEDD